MNVKCDDLVAAGVLTEKECEFAANLRIPYCAMGDLWYEKHRIDSLIRKAVEAGTINEVPREQVIIQRGHEIIGDYINGPNGAVQSQIDGKMYDSKSEYYKSVKAAGCVVMGTDAPREGKGPEATICEKDLGRDIKQAIEQLEGRA
jgi:hypothetical protein